LARGDTEATKVAAANLQADLFRLTSFGLMGVERPVLEKIAYKARRDEAALEHAVAGVLARSAETTERELLRDALAPDLRRSSNAVANLLSNPGWGATTARNAAVALDSVIAHAQRVDDDAEAVVALVEREALAASERQGLKMLALLVLGTVGVVLINLLVARRI